jgi:biopolymer transport protein ExbD
MPKVIIPLLVSVCLLGCQPSLKSRPDSIEPTVVVASRDANSAYARDDSLRLVLEVKGDGQLRLNKIDIGNVSDTSELSEKLKVIFDERARDGIQNRAVFIEPLKEVDQDQIKALVNVLVQSDASQIQIVIPEGQGDRSYRSSWGK